MQASLDQYFSKRQAPENISADNKRLKLKINCFCKKNHEKQKIHKKKITF